MIQVQKLNWQLILSFGLVPPSMCEQVADEVHEVPQVSLQSIVIMKAG